MITKKLDHYYRNHDTQQVRDDMANKFFIAIIMAGLVMTGASYISFDTVQAREVEQEVQKELSAIEIKKQPAIGGDRHYDEISFIVIHHTATRDDLSASEMKLSMERTYINNRGGSVIPTHYIIDKRGNVQRVNPINKIVGATLNEVANNEGVHIELIGDFNINKPTDEQYNTLNSLIAKIEKEIGSPLQIRGHGDFQPKNCPGENFDFSRVVSQKYKVGDTIQFNQITAYYTPLPTDTKFSHKAYERSKAINGDFVNAMGWDYKDEHKYHHGACGRRFNFKTILHIEGRGDVVCVDRGSAIDNTDFDIWYGIGDEALENIGGGVIHPEEAKVTIVYIP